MRGDFAPLIYTVGELTGKYTRTFEKRIVTLLAKKWQRQYSEMVRIV